MTALRSGPSSFPSFASVRAPDLEQKQTKETKGLLTVDDIRRVLGDCQRQGTRYSQALIETVATTFGR